MPKLQVSLPELLILQVYVPRLTIYPGLLMQHVRLPRGLIVGSICPGCWRMSSSVMLVLSATICPACWDIMGENLIHQVMHVHAQAPASEVSWLGMLLSSNIWLLGGK